ncbi:Holliday junction branch migration protein RuvA [Candidatus Gottesmanbacteria bacterium]|nr:Holliday junction branch migration protein RuvA [Candidatus Gottesmanbacteria bacterium]
MISYLEGTIKHQAGNFVILLVNGVGYKVFAPVDTIAHLKPNQKTAFFIYDYIKEDAFDLYGFSAFEDLQLFELFLTVSGVGPKTALAVFSNGKPAKIKEAIVKGDVDFFTSVPRLGKKNAQKIIIELRPKLGSLAELDLTAETGEIREIFQALKSFGFNPSEAKEALKAIKDTEGDTSAKIREALRFLGKKPT